MPVGSAIFFGLVLLHGNSMRVGPSVLSNACYLPGNFYVRFICLYGKSMISDLTCYHCLRKLADYRQLIAKISIQSFEPLGQIDNRKPLTISDDVSIVDIHHVRRFHEGVIQVFVGRIEWVIDLEGAT